MSKTNPVFIEAYKHIRNGQLKAARQKLRSAIKVNPHSERAWLLMSMAVTDARQQQECLRRVLALNPDHVEAQQRLAKLQPTVEITPVIEIEPSTENVSQPEALEAPLAEEPPPVESNVLEIATPESEPEVLAVPEPSGVAETEVILEEAPALTAEATPNPEPEAWTAEPERLPEWLIAQSMVDADLPDVEPVSEADFENAEAEEEFEVEAEAAEIISAEVEAQPETAPSPAVAEPPEPNESTEPEAPSPTTPRAKRRRARRLHTDYLLAHQTPVEEELPAWLTDEAEVASRPAPSQPQPPSPPPAPVVASAPVARPAASFEPAPIRVRASRPVPEEKEPARPYYSGSYLQGDTPSWALPLVILLLSIAVIGVLAFLIYLVL